MRIVGVSFDPPEANARWAEKEGFPFELWSDTDRVLARHYDAEGTFGAARVTVVLDERGETVLRYPEVNAGTHPADVLDDVRKVLRRR